MRNKASFKQFNLPALLLFATLKQDATAIHSVLCRNPISAVDSLAMAASGSDLLTNGHADGRRTSAPLMPAFMVSAPGKVIVFGEHAVVHGKVGAS